MSRVRAGCRRCCCHHTRESRAYILLVAVLPRGWGGLWGSQWLLGATRKELGLCHDRQLQSDLGLPQHGGTAGEINSGSQKGLTSTPRDEV